jgi:hypothetical protein
VRTSRRLRLRREIVVDPRQQRQDSGIDERFVAQLGPPSDCPVERRGTPRWLEWSSSPRGFRYSPRRPCSRRRRSPSSRALTLKHCCLKAEQARGSTFSRHGRPAACVVRSPNRDPCS